MIQSPRYAFAANEIARSVHRVRESATIVRENASGRVGLGVGEASTEQGLTVLATLPPLYPEWLGDRSFAEAHGVRFPYVAGEMANGIATTELVIAMARAHMLGFFGAAGLDAARVERAVVELEEALGERAPWGVNLIHSPAEPALEDAVADMLVRRNVACVSASAFMALTPAVVRCSAAGLRIDAQGRLTRRSIFAKVSRPEVARAFLSPAPAEMLRALVSRGQLTMAEAELAARIPVAEDVTVEADSGGHTDNQTLTVVLPAIMALRDELVRKHGYQRPLRVGAAGGLGTPAALAAAFALGADYVVTGSVNQSAVEAGLSEDAKAMLAQTDIGDVMMAPAADMFELGVKVQVLKRGTMFGVRAAKLYDLYTSYPSLEAIPSELRARLERDVLHATIDEIWRETAEFWQRRELAQLTRAEAEPKHRMALVFRWYLGKSSRWAIDGERARRTDYQIWCGPAMGVFNRWVAGSFLAEPQNRHAAQIALNLLEGAAVITRAHQLRTYGLPVPPEAFQFAPRPMRASG